MKILQINNKFTGAGAENVMKILGAELSQRGHEICYGTYENISQEKVFTIKNPSTNIVNSVNKIDKFIHKFSKTKTLSMDDPNKSIMKRISLNQRNIIPLKDPITKRSMEKIIKKEKPNLVHCHNVLPSLTPISVAKDYGIPTIVTLHGYWPVCPLSNRMQIKTNKICNLNDWDLCNNFCASSFVDVEKYMKKLKHFIIENVDYLIPVSDYLKNLLIKYSYPEDKIITIHNGVDTDVFKPIFPCFENKVIHVGRLSYHKGSHIFIEVAKKLWNSYPEIKFLLIGAGLNKFNLSSEYNIEYPGWISTDELINTYSSSLCTIIPSIWPEPHPLIPLESMSCGTPVIGSKIAGIEESIIDKKTGFLIDPTNKKKMVKEISDRVIYFYQNKEERLKMGENARAHMNKKFTKEFMVNKYIKVYKKLIGKV